MGDKLYQFTRDVYRQDSDGVIRPSKETVVTAISTHGIITPTTEVREYILPCSIDDADFVEIRGGNLEFQKGHGGCRQEFKIQPRLEERF
jgi:hypothetical protein